VSEFYAEGEAGADVGWVRDMYRDVQASRDVVPGQWDTSEWAMQSKELKQVLEF
jgi:hypothetical protein